MLRSHQVRAREICRGILAGDEVSRIYADVTPGGGRSGIPPILANELIPHIADKILWVVPRLTLREQAEGEFKSVHAAAIVAGIITPERRRVSISMDPQRAARLIKKHFVGFALLELRNALNSDEAP